MIAVQIDDLRKALSYEAESGLLFWARTTRRVKAGEPAGTKRKDNYIQINACGRILLAHRIAWVLTHGVWPEGDVDHIDGNPSNNRLVNLRDVSRLMNMQNQRRPHKNNKSSGLLGVSFDARTSMWLAKISVLGQTKNIGRFKTPEIAHAAYIDAKRALHQGSNI